MQLPAGLPWCAPPVDQSVVSGPLLECSCSSLAVSGSTTAHSCDLECVHSLPFTHLSRAICDCVLVAPSLLLTASSAPSFNPACSFPFPPLHLPRPFRKHSTQPAHRHKPSTMATNPPQLFLLADHIKLSLLERQRALSLNLPSNSQDGQISRSLEQLRSGIESLESQVLDTSDEYV